MFDTVKQTGSPSREQTSYLLLRGGDNGLRCRSYLESLTSLMSGDRRLGGDGLLLL